ncbi:MAG: hypothetical protein AAGA99_18235 [Actinomycetota bacterium]
MSLAAWTTSAGDFERAGLATLTHDEHLDAVLEGYGVDVDRELIDGWRAWRCLTAIRWLMENGYGDPQTFPEADVLRRLGES